MTRRPAVAQFRICSAFLPFPNPAMPDSSRSTPTSVLQAFSGLSDDEMEILATADRFASQELYPLAQRMDDEEWWPADAFPVIGATGYFGITTPDTYGGSG